MKTKKRSNDDDARLQLIVCGILIIKPHKLTERPTVLSVSMCTVMMTQVRLDKDDWAITHINYLISLGTLPKYDSSFLISFLSDQNFINLSYYTFRWEPFKLILLHIVNSNVNIPMLESYDDFWILKINFKDH